MICDHDLYDLSEVFVFEFNQIRKALTSISCIDKEAWYFISFENVYTHFSILKDKEIYKLLINACERLKELIDKSEFDNAYDLVDCIHCLPDIIAENRFTIPKSYWKSHVKYYRDKWDKSFLLMEQRKLKNNRH